jgi:hypothetical protein
MALASLIAIAGIALALEGSGGLLGETWASECCGEGASWIETYVRWHAKEKVPALTKELRLDIWGSMHGNLGQGELTAFHFARSPAAALPRRQVCCVGLWKE